jgi:hypothetical protein
MVGASFHSLAFFAFALMCDFLAYYGAICLETRFVVTLVACRVIGVAVIPHYVRDRKQLLLL